MWILGYLSILRLYECYAWFHILLLISSARFPYGFTYSVCSFYGFCDYSCPILCFVLRFRFRFRFRLSVVPLESFTYHTIIPILFLSSLLSVIPTIFKLHSAISFTLLRSTPFLFLTPTRKIILKGRMIKRERSFNVYIIRPFVRSSPFFLESIHAGYFMWNSILLFAFYSLVLFSFFFYT